MRDVYLHQQQNKGLHVHVQHYFSDVIILIYRKHLPSHCWMRSHNFMISHTALKLCGFSFYLGVDMFEHQMDKKWYYDDMDEEEFDVRNRANFHCF